MSVWFLADLLHSFLSFGLCRCPRRIPRVSQLAVTQVPTLFCTPWKLMLMGKDDALPVDRDDDGLSLPRRRRRLHRPLGP